MMAEICVLTVSRVQVLEVHGNAGRCSGEHLLETGQAHTAGPNLLPQL